MKKIILIGAMMIAATATFIGCTSQSEPSVVSKENVGKEITVEGWAVTSKAGAYVVGEDFRLWVDGLDSWPEEYYSGGEKGEKVKITGILGEDNNLPVFIEKEGEPIVQGIPVPEGTDLEEASHRFVIKEAKWELLEKRVEEQPEEQSKETTLKKIKEDERYVYYEGEITVNGKYNEWNPDGLL